MPVWFVVTRRSSLPASTSHTAHVRGTFADSRSWLAAPHATRRPSADSDTRPPSGPPPLCGTRSKHLPVLTS